MYRFTSLLLTSLLAAAIALPSPARAELRAGTAVVDITPQEWPLAPRGSFTPRPVDSAHDPLKVRCLVLDDGETQIAVVICDNLGIVCEVYDQARKLIGEDGHIFVELRDI